MRHVEDIPLQDVEEMRAEARIEYDILAVSRTMADVFRDGAWVGVLHIESSSEVLRKDRHTFAPIPFELFTTLVHVPGNAWAVYLGLWHRSRLLRQQTLTCTPLTIPGSTCAQRSSPRITPLEQRRALDALSRAGLVTVTYRRHRPPRVTLREGEIPWMRG